MELLERLLLAQSYMANDKEIRKIIEKEVKRAGANWKTDDIGNIIAWKGSAPYPCYCAHMDTVHELVKKKEVEKHLIIGDIYYTSRNGIGGDDYAGVWACLKLLQYLQEVEVIFLVQEEFGQIGANHINLDEFEECKFVCEIDRKGNSDIIIDYLGLPTASAEFEDDLLGLIPEGDTWELAEGFVTDVMILLERGIGLSVMNLSSGYYYPHSKEELVSWKDLKKSYRLAWELSKLEETYPHNLEMDTETHSSCLEGMLSFEDFRDSNNN